MPLARRRTTERTAKREEAIENVAEEHPPAPEPVEPKVSAILVVHNQAAALRRAIGALERSQDRERLEILVVDCASQDDSGRIDTEYESVVVMRLPHHFGATKARNIATRTAKAEFVFFLSPNVEVAPDTVQRLAGRLDADADSIAVCPLLVDAEHRPVSKIQELPTRATLAAACRGDEVPTLAIDLQSDSVDVEYPGIDALMVRKSFLKSMNYFDARFGHFWADADLAARIFGVQKKIRLFPGIRAVYHDEPDPDAGDALFDVDRALGAAVFLSKYDGFFSGLTFRIAAIFRALIGFRFRELTALLSGQKLDGSQAM
ncbi:MAG TPA: glycosyltransferase [Bryobacteraceae bacterium]|nr:glycosyltransferase [Bryobacteraceae bacterium]